MDIRPRTILNTRLSEDFKDFLKLLNSNRVEYLLIGSYAVGHYGYPRGTVDLDVWISTRLDNAEKMKQALVEFGIPASRISSEVLTEAHQVFRMGIPPHRVEALTTISGVSFDECYAARELVVIDGVEVSLISLAHLKINKKASGRLKDLSDLENLP
jgi:hypothetical protein